MMKYIVFDFDGTLVDSLETSISVYNEIAKKKKFNKIEKEDIGYLKKLSNSERCKFLKCPMYKIPFLAVEFHNLYKKAMKNIVFFDGIKNMLSELKNKGYSLAIISSNSESNIREFLKENRIDFIEEVFCSNNLFGKDKVIKKFLKNHNLKNSEVIYVGDEQRDVVACKKTGVEVIWVGWGYDIIDVVQEENPNYIVNTPKEILAII